MKAILTMLDGKNSNTLQMRLIYIGMLVIKYLTRQSIHGGGSGGRKVSLSDVKKESPAPQPPPPLPPPKSPTSPTSLSRAVITSRQPANMLQAYGKHVRSCRYCVARKRTPFSSLLLARGPDSGYHPPRPRISR